MEFEKHLPKDWKLTKWESVLTITNGKSQREVLEKKGEFPIYGSGGVMGYANKYLCEAGSTIIGRKGTINNPIFVDRKFWNVDTAFGITAGKNLDSKFLFYFCKGYNFLLHNKSTTLPSLTKSDLLKIEIPFPPLPEQTRIVAKLDALFERIDKAVALLEANIKKTGELRKAILYNTFEEQSSKWSEFLLKEKFRLLNGRAYVKNELLNQGKYPVIRIQNLNGGSNYYYSDLELERDKYCENGDLLYSWSGTPGTSFGAFIWEGGKAIFHYHIWKLEFLDQIDKIFAHYLLKHLTQIVIENSHGVTGMMHTTKEKMENFTIKIPNPTLQSEVALKLTSIESRIKNLETKQTQKLQSLQSLKSSLLDQAFRGEL